LGAHPSEDDLPSAAAQVERARARFEEAWQGGARPRAEEFLAGVPEPERSALLRELLRLEVGYRRGAGELVAVEELRARFPGLDLAWLSEVLGLTNADTTDQATVPHPPPPGAPARPTGPALGVGTVLGGYEVLEELGRGGMGMVFKARQRGANRIVALKVIRPDRLEDLTPEQRRRWLERFRTEAQAAARVEHDHIVAVYDVSTADGHPFYAMRYVEGQSLARLLRDGPVPGERAAAYLEPVARAVHHVHGHGILHRDLKPGNVLLGADGRPYVTDFGLAKWLGEAPDLTRVGEGLGSPSYMAPEQVRASAKVTAACDVYGLGATLYALLTGRPPFQAAGVAETLRQVEEDEPVPPRRLNRAIDRDLETICLKCLEKEPGKRYASALALADDLGRFRRGEAIRARPIGAAGRLWRWARRNRRVAALGAAAALLLVLAVIASAAAALSSASARASALRAADAEKGRRQAAEQAGESERLRRGEAEQRAREVQQERDRVNELLYLAYVRSAQGALDAGAWDRVRALLEPFRPRPGWADVRGWEWHYLCNRARGARLALPRREVGLSRPALAWRPDGKVLVTSGAGPLTFWDVGAGAAGGTWPAPAKDASFPAYSPDGKHLAVGAEVREADTGRAVLTLAGGRPPLAWGPDGRRLAARATDGGTVQVWDAATGRPLRALPLPAPETTMTSALVWGPDGKRLAAPTRGGMVRVWDAGTGQVLRDLSGPAEALAWTAGGQRLALAGADGTVQVWDLDAGKRVLARRLPVADPWTPSPTSQRAGAGLAWSPGGRRLAVASGRRLSVWAAESGEELLDLSADLGPEEEAVGALAWGPDGRRLAALGQRGSVWVWPVGGARRPALRVLGAWPDLSGASGTEDRLATFAPLAWSPGGRRLATLRPDGGATVWDAGSRQALLALGEPVRALDLQSLAWGPDGKRLATGGRDGAVGIWDVTTGEPVRTLTGHKEPVTALAWSGDGRRLASASKGLERAAKVWDVGTGRMVRTLPSDASPVLAWSRDGSRLAVGSRVYDADTWAEKFSLELSQLTLAAWGPDGKYLATVAGGQGKVWDADTGDEVFTLFPYSAAGLAWGPEGKRVALLVTRPQDRRGAGVTILDLEAGKEVRFIPTGKLSSFFSLRQALWSADGKFLALEGSQGGWLVDAETGKVVSALPHQGVGAWSADGKSFAVLEAGRVQICSADRKVRRTLGEARTTGLLTCLAWGGLGVASGSQDGTVKVWDAATGKVLRVLPDLRRAGEARQPEGPPGALPRPRTVSPAAAVAFGHDGRTLAATNAQGLVRVWDAVSGEVLHRWEVTGGKGSPPGWPALVVSTLAWGPDGKALALGGRGEASVWDLATGRKVRALPGGPLLAWGPDGRQLAVGDERGTVRVYEAATGKEVRLLIDPLAGGDQHLSFTGLAFSPDGRRLASVGGGPFARHVRLWDVASGQDLVALRLPRLPGLPPDDLRIAWSKDGRLLAVASARPRGGQAAVIWDGAPEG
jgi:WD40 repeat protein/tRNA A-37 threonylcarbamoyl transferase component Bud32